MRKLLTALCAIGAFGLTAAAYAQDDTTTKTKTNAMTEQTTDGARHSMKSEKKHAVTDRAGTTSDETKVDAETQPTEAGGSEKTVEKTVKHSAPHHPTKTVKSREKVTRDANGNVTSDQKTRE